MKIISVKKLNYLYQKIINSKQEEYNFFPKSYLNLSVHLSRDHREFDIHNFNLIKNLISSRYLNLKSTKNKNAFQNYLLSFKESRYLPSNNLFFVIFLDILKLLKQIIDISILFLIILNGTFINRILNKRYQKQFFIQKRIFSIYYWEQKKLDSATYYYPSIFNSNNNLIYISSFADSKFLSTGLLNSLKYKNFLSPGNCLSIKGLFLSLFQFIHLFSNDLFLAISKREYSFLKFWFGWKKASEIFYSILNFNTIKELAKNSKDCEFISWSENQVTNRSFSLAVSFSKRSFKSDCRHSSYFGTPFSRLNKKQYLPEKVEFKNGIWGNKFYMQDQESLDEMNLYLSEKNMDINLEIIPNSMKRIKPNKNFRSQNILISREFTIFTHDSYWDLISCVLALFYKKNKNYKELKKLLKKSNLIYIRLHPSLSKEKALKNLNLIKEIPKNIKFEFINNEKETIIDSMKYSSYCFFGLSSYINLALKLKCNVIAVTTSHLYKNPIKYDLQKSPYLKISYPW